MKENGNSAVQKAIGGDSSAWGGWFRKACLLFAWGEGGATSRSGYGNSAGCMELETLQKKGRNMCLPFIDWASMFYGLHPSDAALQLKLKLCLSHLETKAVRFVGYCCLESVWCLYYCLCVPYSAGVL